MKIKKKDFFLLILDVILAVFLLTKMNFHSDPILKYLLLILFSIPFDVYYFKINGGNITVSLEIIPLLGIFLAFNNIYFATFILLMIYLAVDLIRKVRVEYTLRRLFIISFTVILTYLIFISFRDKLIFMTLSLSFKYLLLLVLLISVFKQIGNIIFIFINRKYSKTYFLRDILAFGFVFFISLVYTVGYSFFWDKMQEVGTVIFIVFFILIAALLQYVSNYSETKKKYRLLLSMMGKIIEKTNLDEQLNAIIAAILGNYKVHFISIWLTDEKEKRNILRVCKPEELLIDKIDYLPIDTGLIGQTVTSAEITYIPDVTAVDNYYEGLKGVKSELVIPLIFKNKVIGVIDLESNEKYYFNQFLIDLFTELSNQLALIINNSIINEKLKEQNKEVEKVIKNVKDLTVDIKESYGQIEQQLSNVNTKLSNFSQKTRAINDRVNEISSREKTVDINMKKINDKIEDNIKTSEETDNRFIATMKIFNSILIFINQSHDKVKGLLGNLENIDLTLKSLHEISERTNILSFNAAIEAARAGKLGRGFAVVANNIKELVNKSEKNILNTTDLINEIKDLILNLDHIFKEQETTSSEAQTTIDSLKTFVEKLINDSNIENDNFSNQLTEMKETLITFSDIFSDLTKSDITLEEIRVKNNEIVNQANFLTEKINQVEILIENLLKMVE